MTSSSNRNDTPTTDTPETTLQQHTRHRVSFPAQNEM